MNALNVFSARLGGLMMKHRGSSDSHCSSYSGTGTSEILYFLASTASSPSKWLLLHHPTITLSHYSFGK
jgi:hypothetical protein